MSDSDQPLRILFSSPAYWPARAFGGPISMATELNTGAATHGHTVDVLTTSLLDVHRGLSLRTRTADVGGVTVRYLATPMRYRWMGITPTLPLWLFSAKRPDVVHIFGFRDVVGTLVARWAARQGIPYVFEPLGMFQPRVRKLRLKRIFDSSVARGIARGAAAIVATSEHERRQMIANGVPAERIEIRGNGFPPPASSHLPTGVLRQAVGDGSAPLVLYVGRLARGKGIELLLAALRTLDGVHLALVGPDDGHGILEDVWAAQQNPVTAGRIHLLGPSDRPHDLYADADVFVLPSEGESFGMAAAEAAAAGTPVVVTDRCGIAEVLGNRGALVVPYDAKAIRDAIDRILTDSPLRVTLTAGGRVVAAENTWDVMVQRQEAIYRLAMTRRG